MVQTLPTEVWRIILTSKLLCICSPKTAWFTYNQRDSTCHPLRNRLRLVGKLFNQILAEQVFRHISMNYSNDHHNKNLQHIAASVQMSSMVRKYTCTINIPNRADGSRRSSMASDERDPDDLWSDYVSTEDRILRDTPWSQAFVPVNMYETHVESWMQMPNLTDIELRHPWSCNNTRHNPDLDNYLTAFLEALFVVCYKKSSLPYIHKPITHLDLQLVHYFPSNKCLATLTAVGRGVSALQYVRLIIEQPDSRESPQNKWAMLAHLVQSSTNLDCLDLQCNDDPWDHEFSPFDTLVYNHRGDDQLNTNLVVCWPNLTILNLDACMLTQSTLIAFLVLHKASLNTLSLCNCALAHHVDADTSLSRWQEIFHAYIIAEPAPKRLKNTDLSCLHMGTHDSLHSSIETDTEWENMLMGTTNAVDYLGYEDYRMNREPMCRCELRGTAAEWRRGK